MNKVAAWASVGSDDLLKIVIPLSSCGLSRALAWTNRSGNYGADHKATKFLDSCYILHRVIIPSALSGKPEEGVMMSRKSSTLALLALCLLGSSAAASAGESAPASDDKKSTIVTDPVPSGKPVTEKESQPAKIVTDETPTGRSDAPREKPAIPSASSSATEPAAAGAAPSAAQSAQSPSDPMALLYSDKVAPGAFEAKRQLLLSSIKVAKKQNFGITSYLNELSKIEDQIKQGNASPQLEARIDSIADGLTDQLKRSQILKTQRPAASGGARTSYSGSGGPSAPGASGHRNTDAIINELRQKYGDKIPAGLDNNELKEKLMKSDLAKEYLRKFTSGQ